MDKAVEMCNEVRILPPPFTKREFKFQSWIKEKEIKAFVASSKKTLRIESTLAPRLV